MLKNPALIVTFQRKSAESTVPMAESADFCGKGMPVWTFVAAATAAYPPFAGGGK